MPEHQKVQKRSQKTKQFRTKEEICAMRSDFGSCRTKSIRTKWLMQKWRQNFRVCRQEKKEEAAMLRKQVIAAWEALWQQIIAFGTNRVEAMLQRYRGNGSDPGADARKRRRKKEQ